MYDVNGFAVSTLLIASFDDEEFAVAVTRSLFTLKASAEVYPQPEARFIDVDMIVEDETTKERTIGDIIDQNYSYIVCIYVGYMIGFIIACVVL